VKVAGRRCPNPGVGENGIECGSEVRAPVADHELDPGGLATKIHDQIPGLLGGPLPGGVQGEPEDADMARRVADHGQDVGLGAVEQVNSEEAAGQDRLSLRAKDPVVILPLGHQPDDGGRPFSC
jgi:hypothetical protein